ncbi:MAG TPA: MBL fold metallo-hydrolase [Anaerolineales bacterium]|nr:MBL fold metallo-hydrolase [Anaerolineales bacterium]HMV96911.1 MBL fold metallo-hydrolase [Anaerolineales bacterium]HMX19742.1 MBL fold metallo-hydrolase [Anaerolineales bacterium]HMX76368.1 MBL fold metallo-hydrolase [Anaerolineales bacterium]HMZ44758.1 MBL fold metallo-hydrolase [Anaerolineales bacterium]
MQEITNNVFIEDQFPGVTLGVIVTPRGLIQIDAPPSPEDARSWRAALMNLGGGMERVLVNLDAHPDRTLGARAMDCTVIAHEKTANTFRTRPNTFKAQGEETGADWESIAGLGSVRWAPPEISFLNQMTLHWSDSPVFLEHHPGPASGSIWVHLPNEKILFVGDAVLKNQPPFFAGSNLANWLTTLNLLLSPAYKGYTIISSRGGVVTANIVKAQLDFIKHTHDKLEKSTTKKPNPAATEKLVTSLLTWFKAPAARQKQFAQRLRYGLLHYNARPNHTAGQYNED